MSATTTSLVRGASGGGLAAGARANVHVKVLYGRSSHHHVEAVFKAFARALREAPDSPNAPGASRSRVLCLPQSR